MQCSIGLSEEVKGFVEEYRGALSFSAFAEYLIREGIRSLNAEGLLKVADDAKPRKTLIKIR